MQNLLAALAIVCAYGALAPASAGLTVSSQVTGLLSQFPAGGDGLREAVAQLLETDPSLVDEVVFAARNASPSQKEAIGQGLAGAASYFAECGVGCGEVQRR
jgi:hypothetical protein